MNSACSTRPVVLMGHGASGRGSRASGAITSIFGIIDGLSSDFDFRLAAGRSLYSVNGSARDPSALWLARSGLRSAFGLSRFLRSRRHDLIVLNSLFDRELTFPLLMLRKLGLVPKCPVILAPRGEFAPGALGLKRRRKHAFLAVANRARLFSEIWFHATSAREAGYIEGAAIACRGILQAPDVSNLPDLPARCEESDPRTRPLRIAFIGRISPVKNLHFALDALAVATTSVTFDIFGPVSDRAYWQTCLDRISGQPKNVAARYCGVMEKDELAKALAQYDLMFLPSLAESFGHAVFEALASGVPVLVGDRTPWRRLEALSAGWDLPLDDPSRFAARIDALAVMSGSDRTRLRRGARLLAETTHRENDALRLTRAMYLKVIGASS